MNHSMTGPEKIIQDLWMARATQSLVAGVELDVFTHINEGKRSVKEIARACDASERGMRPLLDALASLGYLSKKGDQYRLEPVAAQFLIRGKEPFLGGFVYETKMTWEGWGHLTDVVKSGRPVIGVDTEEAGRDFFPKLVAAIFPLSYGAAQAACNALPEKTRKQITRILDVAAGSAAWSLPFAEANPAARVTVVDFPEVTAVARQFTDRFNVSDRYDYIEGNLRHVAFKKGYDLAILGHIIHSEGEKWGRKLIKKCFNSLRDGGLLLIAEMIPNDARTGPPLPLLFDLNMLVHTEQGGVFTMKEYRAWLKEAGFKKVRTIEAPSPSPLILATK
ncbi:MAG: methyltransferase [Acidobacteriota bacterium]